MNKSYFAGLIVVAIIAIGAYQFPKSTEILSVDKVVELARAELKKFGSAGQDHLVHERFQAGVTLGGNVFATTSAGAVTYPASAFVRPSGDATSLIQHTASGALTATLPASSTLSAFIPKPGDTATIFINPITTDITLAGGTGTDLNVASTSKKINVNSVNRLDFVRKLNSDIEVFLYSGSSF